MIRFHHDKRKHYISQRWQFKVKLLLRIIMYSLSDWYNKKSETEKRLEIMYLLAIKDKT